MEECAVPKILTVISLCALVALVVIAGVATGFAADGIKVLKERSQHEAYQANQATIEAAKKADEDIAHQEKLRAQQKKLEGYISGGSPTSRSLPENRRDTTSDAIKSLSD
jgi:hypothetical protein